MMEINSNSYYSVRGNLLFIHNIVNIHLVNNVIVRHTTLALSEHES